MKPPGKESWRFILFMAHIRLASTYQTALQISMPTPDVADKTKAKIGIIGAFRIRPRKTAASGAAKIIPRAGRQSCRALEITPRSKSPRHGDSRNHEIRSGTNIAAMRGRKDMFASPWVAKPMKVTIRMARMSPRMRM